MIITDAIPVALPRTPVQEAVASAVAALVRAAPAMREAFARMVEAVAKLLAPLRRMRERLIEAANQPGQVAGLESRYAVRAGLDPAYATPQALDGLVARIMAGDARHRGDGQLRLLTSESRSLVAAAAIRGWCYSYGDGPAILAWHRLMATTVVSVGVSCG